MTASTPSPAPYVFHTQRVLPFSPQQVFAAMADPAKLARWWGPASFTNTFELFEFKTGGRWVFVMHGPDGTDYDNENRFDVVTPERVVVRHVALPHFTLTISMTPAGEGGQHTLVDWHQSLDDPQVAAKMRHIIEPANEQNLDRWTAVLEGN